MFRRFVKKKGLFRCFVSLFRGLVMPVYITLRGARIYILISKVIFSFAFFSPEKQLNRDTKLIAILRLQYGIMLTALKENIFRIGPRRFATPPNTEYIFFQLAVNIMPYCRLKIAISLQKPQHKNNNKTHADSRKSRNR